MYELELAMGGIDVGDKRGKRLYKNNMAENSEAFKQLGNLHRERRQVEYFPQDDKANFSSKPQIISGKDFDTEGSGYFS
jgi:DUF438 domain-containing protein